MCIGKCVLKPTPNPRQIPLAWLSGQSNFWTAKSRNAIVSQEIMILQHLHRTKSACHCLNCGTDLIPSCTSRGHLKKAGSQRGVPVGCGTGYKIICLFFFWCMQWQEPGLYLYTTWKQNDLHSVAQTQKWTYGLFWRKWKLFCFCKLEQLKIHCQKNF